VGSVGVTDTGEEEEEEVEIPLGHLNGTHHEGDILD
jgi:hypothetical protein